MIRSIFTFSADGTGSHLYQIYGTTAIGEVVEVGADGTAKFVIRAEGGFSRTFEVELEGVEVGSEVFFGTDYQSSAALEGARNTVWEWVTAGLEREPLPFTWELVDDLVELTFSDYDQILSIEFAEIEFVLVQEDDIILYRES